MHLSTLVSLTGTLVESVMVQAASAGVVMHVCRRLHVVVSHLAATVAGKLDAAPFALVVQVVLRGVCIHSSE